MIRGQLLATLNLLPLPVRFDARETILLAGSPRSGTTWVGQMVGAAPEFCLVNEPFHPKMPEVRRAGFSWRTYVDPESDWPEGEKVCRRILRGKGVSAKLVYRNGIKLLSGKRLVVKTARVNRLLPWLVRRVDVGGLVYLVRHPCATISSQMAHPRFRHFQRIWEDDLLYLERKLPHLVGYAKTLRTEEELRAVTWALDQHAPLTAPRANGCLLVSYEKLVLAGAAELRRVFSRLRLGAPEKAVEQLRMNSWQARGDSADHARASVEERLETWRRRLTQDQVERILRVVQTIGIRGFGPESCPDFARIGAVDAAAV